MAMMRRMFVRNCEVRGMSIRRAQGFQFVTTILACDGSSSVWKLTAVLQQTHSLGLSHIAVRQSPFASYRWSAVTGTFKRYKYIVFVLHSLSPEGAVRDRRKFSHHRIPVVSSRMAHNTEASNI